MKNKPSKLIIFLALLGLLVLLIFTMLSETAKERRKEANTLLLPSLPKPIAKEYALITSAGQNTDAYIVNDVANKLMIHNYFMPQAEKTDLEGINTLVFVVGYSSTGGKIHETNYQNEKERVQAILEEAKKNGLVVITVYIAGEQRYDKNSEELLKLVAAESDYIIATKGANKKGLISEIGRTSRTPITLINRPKDLTEPFASAFR